MKKLTLIVALLFSTVMFTSSSYAGWTKVFMEKDIDSTTYVDFERIRKNDGYVYYWDLIDYPSRFFYYQTYQKADCRVFRYQWLVEMKFNGPMGRGQRDYGVGGNNKNIKWFYPSPNSKEETILKKVCRHAN